jgi:hypothetical protein
MMWGLSIISIALLFWIDESWKFLTIVLVIVAVTVFFTTLFTDESVRFLCSVRSNFTEAHRILDKVARTNSKEPFVGLLEGEKPPQKPEPPGPDGASPSTATLAKNDGPKLYGYIIL